MNVSGSVNLNFIGLIVELYKQKPFTDDRISFFFLKCTIPLKSRMSSVYLKCSIWLIMLSVHA